MLLCVLLSLSLSCFDLIEEILGDLFDSYSVEFESGDEYGTRRGLSVVGLCFVGFLANRLPQHTVFLVLLCALTMTGVISPSEHFDPTNVLSCTHRVQRLYVVLRSDPSPTTS